MRQYYNRLGLLNSGAFNDALANRFGDIQQQSDQAILNNGVNFENTLQGILGEGYNNQVSLGQAGLQRQYSLEDEAYQAAVNQVLAKQKDQSATKNSLIQGGGGLLGGILGGLCFLADTPVLMADGSEKRIAEISLGDETKGGVVVSTRQAVSNNLFDYKGVGVTGSHAVLDDEQWKRVKDANDVSRLAGVFKIYSIVTSGHRIYVGDLTFADELEHDRYTSLQEANAHMDESIELLNKKMVAGGI